MKSSIFSALLFSLIIACTGRQNQTFENNVKKIDIPRGNLYDEFDISTIYSSGIDLIPLKSESNFVIANIDKIEMHTERFFVLDREQSNTLFIFDKEGNPISSFLSVSDFSLNENYLYLLNSEQDLISVYNFGTMELLTTIDRIMPNVSEIACAGENLLCYREIGTGSKKNSVESSTLFLIDKSGKLLKNWRTIPDSSDYLEFFTTYPSLKSTKDNIYLSRSFSNHFYTLNKEKTNLTHSHEIRFKEHDLPVQMRKITSQFEFYDRLNSENYNYVTGGYLESNEYVFFNIVSTDKNSRTVIYDKKAGASTIYSSFKYSDQEFPIFSLNSLNDNYCISILPMDLIISIKEQIDLRVAKKNKFMEFLRNFDIKNGNPAILIMFK